MEFWQNVIWSDESKFEFVDNRRRRRVWRKKGDAFEAKYLVPTVKHGGGSVMVWGCFSYNGTGKLVFIDGKMTGQKYVEILKNNLEESARMLGIEDDFVFQQDNDPKHTSKVAKEYFDSKKIFVLLWASQSPDMNPIEPLWVEIKRRVPPSSRKNKEMFRKAVLNVWNSFPLVKIRKLMNSVPKRLSAVIKANGGSTKY